MEKMSKYAIGVFYSEEDEGYIAIIPESPGCSVYGEIEKEGRNIPKPRGKEFLNMLYENAPSIIKQ